MKTIKFANSAPIKAWIDERREIRGGELVVEPNIEDSAMVQLKNVAGLPFVSQHGLAVMPDVHWGFGATVGSVIATKGAIIPAAVGVDIGCGMNAIRLNLKAEDLPTSLKEIRHQIERDVPLGTGGAHQRETLIEALGHQLPKLNDGTRARKAVLAVFGEEHSMDKLFKKAIPQIGTLGSGNHFIELCLDENSDVWIMLHSGSRGIGNMIGTYYISKAKEVMERLGLAGTVPDKDLSYLTTDTEEYLDYCEAVSWAQSYAFKNRAVMMDAVLKAVQRHLPIELKVTQEAINCHHNYVAWEKHFGEDLIVTRKGAIKAGFGDLGIIPGSMGARSFIVRGKGNAHSYCSCSHGAGRVMSRGKAKKELTVADLIAQTEGVECRKDKDVLDEAPAAYKDIDQVMANQTDLVEIVHTLKQVMCVKGA